MEITKMSMKLVFLLTSVSFTNPALPAYADNPNGPMPPTRDIATPVFRLYNPNSGEHFLTSSERERYHLNVEMHWIDEGFGAWYAPLSGEPVYRLYNANVGDHYYTLSSFERDNLVEQGWKDEGVAFYSGGDYEVYLAYNPNALSGAHNYTVSLFEQNSLLSQGWTNGTVAFKAAGMYAKYYAYVE